MPHANAGNYEKEFLMARFPFERLPAELQAKVIDQAAKFPDRREARATILDFRLVSRASNYLISTNRPLREHYDNLQTHSLRDSPRISAAHRNMSSGMTAPEAIARQHVTDPQDILVLKRRGALQDYLYRNFTAQEALDHHEVTDQGTILRIRHIEARDIRFGHRPG